MYWRRYAEVFVFQFKQIHNSVIKKKEAINMQTCAKCTPDVFFLFFLTGISV